MIYTVEEFFNYFKDNKFIYYIAYEGHLNEKSIKEKMPIETQVTKDETTHEECYTRIENLFKRKPGKYTFLLMRKSFRRDHASRVCVDSYAQLNVIDYTQNNQENSQEHAPTIFTAEMVSKMVDDQVKAALKAQEDLREQNALKEELARLKDNGGKAAFFFAELLKQMNIVPKMPTMPGTVMQGTDHVPADKQPLTEVQQRNLEKAHGIFLEKLDYVTIINLAKKMMMPENEGMIQMIKNYANT